MGRRSSGKKTRTGVDTQLDRLYARIPDMLDCKGLCYDSCTSIDMAPAERARIREAGVDIPYVGPDPDHRCPALTDLGRCSVYSLRPVICRLMGTAEDLTCEHGCQPAQWLTPVESRRLIADSLLIGGDERRGREEHALADALEHNPIVRARYEALRAVSLRRAEHLQRPTADADPGKPT